MSKTITPCNDRIVIKPIDEGEQTYGSIVIPDMGKEKPEMGEVISVGPGRLSEYGKMIPIRSCPVDVFWGCLFVKTGGRHVPTPSPKQRRCKYLSLGEKAVKC